MATASARANALTTASQETSRISMRPAYMVNGRSLWSAPETCNFPAKGSVSRLGSRRANDVLESLTHIALRFAKLRFQSIEIRRISSAREEAHQARRCFLLDRKGVA